MIFFSERELRELLVAAEIGNVERMRNLVAATKQYQMTHGWMTQCDKKGRTPLHLASIWGYMNVVSFILEEIVGSTDNNIEQNQMYLNLTDHKGRTPLFHAVAEGRNNVAQVLIEKGADIEAATNQNHIEPGSTSLMACAEKNNKEAFQFMLCNGANVLAVRNDGADALYIAARYGHLKIVEQLLQTNHIESIINRPTFRGRTALMTAAFHNHDKVCKLLFQHGADLSHQDDNKFTALILASNKGHVDLVKWLILNGAKVSVKDRYGKTALKYADENGFVEIASYLKMGGNENVTTRKLSVKEEIKSKGFKETKRGSIKKISR